MSACGDTCGLQAPAAAPSTADDEMVWIAGGVFHMGSDDHHPEEALVHEVVIQGFWIDRTPVTNRMFAHFVAETGHVTRAEQWLCAEHYPDADPRLLVPVSLVFVPPDTSTNAGDWTRRWRFAAGADWRHPHGPGSGIGGLADHPVVHVCHDDAAAFGRWDGKALPIEAEWEHAAPGGLDRLPVHGAAGALDAHVPRPAFPQKVLKGGSHLCAPSYCRRYRPAARQPQTIDTVSVHIGFRCVRRSWTS